MTIKPLFWIIVLLLTACGYHPRGAFTLPANLNNIYLSGASPELQEHFKKILELSSIPLATSADTAGIIINVTGESSERRVLSLSAGGTANDFELDYRFDYELLDAQGKLLSARQPVAVKREYYNNQLAIIAKDSEESVIRNEMYQQAVRTVMNRASVALHTQGH
ncbi:MAG: hypothetical protein HOP34_15595 [Methylococcaceae bacterium]|nr:hypothetical protein [Methylococcaceae bacterium]